MRKAFVVSYDISAPKRLRLVHTKMRGYGDAVQYSVFLCRLSPQEKALMIEVLWRLIKHDEDQVLIIDLGPAEGRAEEVIEVIGKPRPALEHKAVVL